MSGLFLDVYTDDIVPGTDKFNGDLSNWDVSKVADMGATLFSASSFNADISNWNVSTVTDMGAMFYSASSFNADLSKWDVSSV
jgi:surface protein